MLNDYERIRSFSNLKDLRKINKTFDVKHFKLIHKTIFKDIYSWAGEFRQVDMSKGKSDFCDYQLIPFKLKKLFNTIPEFEDVKDDKEAFSEKLCLFYLNLNHIHAFREGNGRTQNHFISQLCEKFGYELDFQNILDRMKNKKNDDYNKLFEEFEQTGDYSNLKKFLFDDNLRKKELKNQNVLNVKLKVG